MSGLEHFREAERLLDGVKGNPPPTSSLDAQIDQSTVLAAQAHAMLAVAAALVDGSTHDRLPQPVWRETLS